MAILDYSGDAGIFRQLGAIVNIINLATNDIDDFGQYQTEVLNNFNLANQEVAVAPLLSTIDGIEQNLSSLRPALAAMCDLRLQDYSTVIDPLAISQSDVQSVLYALQYAMTTDAASVKGNTVTVGSVTAGGSNVGNGTILITTILDGFSPPTAAAISHPLYLGRTTEFPVSETITARVIQDSYSDGQAAGSEVIAVNGQVAPNGTWSTSPDGSGQGPNIQTLQAGTILQNMSFETWSVTDVPDNFTMVGTVTTNYGQEASIVYRGTYALKLIGNGATATISAFQAVSASQVTPLRAYCVSIRYRISTIDTASQTFSVKFTGTGYSAGATEKITVLGNVMPTSYTLGYFFVNLPAVIPSDFGLTISWSGTPNSGKTVYLDDLGFAPVQYHSGLGFAAVAGSTNFVKYDSWTVAIANSGDAVFQSFVTRNYKTQLPSSLTGAETISDNLAY